MYIANRFFVHLGVFLLLILVVPLYVAAEDEKPANYWQNHGWLFSLALVIQPQITLLFFSSVPWTLPFVLASVFFPEVTAISLFFERGYHYKHWLLLLGYIPLAFLRFFKFEASEQQVASSNEGTVNEDGSVNYNLAPEVLNVLVQLVQNVTSLSKRLEQQQNLMSLLKCDSTILRSLNFKQLQFLEDELENQIHIVRKAREGTYPCNNSGLRSQTCSICLADPSVVELHPCGHNQLCEACFDSYRETDAGDQCPICRLPILSYTFSRAFSDQVSLDQYSQETRDTTHSELQSLTRYVNENPSLFSRLNYCNEENWNTLVSARK